MLFNGVSVGTISVFGAGCACAVRFALTRMELANGTVTVVNFFRTIRLPAGAIGRAGFPAARWHGSPVPLMLVGQSTRIRVSGVSAWIRMFQWPDQPLVRGTRNLRRMEQFFQGTGIVFDPHEPVQPA